MIAALWLAACASGEAPARKLLGDIQTTLDAAAPEARKYAPDQLRDVESRLSELKTQFDRRQYAAVAAGAPAILEAAQKAAAAAAAAKVELMKTFDRQWSAYAALLPEDIDKLQARIAMLRLRQNRRAAAAVNIAGAQASLSGAASLWSKAQAAFAAGNLEEAIDTAMQSQVKIERSAAALKIDLPAA